MRPEDMVELMSVSREIQTILEESKEKENYISVDVYGRLVTILDKVDDIISNNSLVFD